MLKQFLQRELLNVETALGREKRMFNTIQQRDPINK